MKQKQFEYWKTNYKFPGQNKTPVITELLIDVIGVGNFNELRQNETSHEMIHWGKTGDRSHKKYYFSINYYFQNIVQMCLNYDVDIH